MAIVTQNPDEIKTSETVSAFMRRFGIAKLIVRCGAYKENDILLSDRKTSQDILDEIVELMVDVVCSTAMYIRVAKDDKSAEVVKSQFLKLDGGHIRFVMGCMEKNTTKIRNMRQYRIL